MNNLPVGTILISNNTRLIITGYNSNGYLVCVCNEQGVMTNKTYVLQSNQIEKVLSLGYVENIKDDVNVIEPFSNNVVSTPINNESSGQYKFDANGFVISE